MQKTLSTKKGFTLIEIVIALAIAALIIVIVLLGIQGAQRAQRNDARRAVADRVRAAITDARANLGTAGITTNPSPQQVEDATANLSTGFATYDNVTAGGAFASGCTAHMTGTGGTVNVGFNPDNANICLEGGANYQSR